MNAQIAKNANLLVSNYQFNEYQLDLYGSYTENWGVDIDFIALTGQKFDIAGLMEPSTIEKLNDDCRSAVERVFASENAEVFAELHQWHREFRVAA